MMRIRTYADLKPGDFFVPQGPDFELRFLLARRTFKSAMSNASNAAIADRTSFIVLIDGVIHDIRFWSPHCVKVRVL